MERVMIIGGPGAGKSWLAQQMAIRLDLPVVAIDDLLRHADGRQRSDAEIDAAAIAVTREDRWIIEGGNSRTYAERLDRADWLIHLNPPRLLRLWRVLRRGGATRGLLHWCWNYDSVFGPRDDAVIGKAVAGKKVSQLRSRRDVAGLLQSLPCPSGTPPSPISKAQNQFTTKGSLAPPD